MIFRQRYSSVVYVSDAKKILELVCQLICSKSPKKTKFDDIFSRLDTTYDECNTQIGRQTDGRSLDDF